MWQILLASIIYPLLNDLNGILLSWLWEFFGFIITPWTIYLSNTPQHVRASIVKRLDLFYIKQIEKEEHLKYLSKASRRAPSVTISPSSLNIGGSNNHASTLLGEHIGSIPVLRWIWLNKKIPIPFFVSRDSLSSIVNMDIGYNSSLPHPQNIVLKLFIFRFTPSSAIKKLSELLRIHEIDSGRTITFSKPGMTEFTEFFSLVSKRRILRDTNKSKIPFPTELNNLTDKIYRSMNTQHVFEPGRFNILLHGPPGTGKTTFAKSIALQCEFPIIKVNPYSSRELVLYNDLYPQCTYIILLDEFDSFFKNDGNTVGKRKDQLNKISLISESKQRDDQEDAVLEKEDFMHILDGTLLHNHRIICIASTNNIDKIPKSVQRTGRFHKTIFMGSLSGDYLKKCLKHISKTQGVCVSPKDLSMWSQQLSGKVTVAELENIMFLNNPRTDKEFRDCMHDLTQTVL